MKKKALLLTLTLSISSMTFAGPCEDHRGKNVRTKSINKLNLTQEQQKSFEAIMQTKKESMKAAKNVVDADTKIELAKVLTSEQMQILEERQQQRQGNMKKRKHMRHE